MVAFDLALDDAFYDAMADDVIDITLNPPPVDAAYLDDDSIRWIENNFYLYDSQQLITLHERQRRPLVEALRKDENGRYIYSTILWSWVKKSAKSSIVAAICEYVAVNYPRSSIKVIANDLKQADSRVGFYLRESIKLHPYLSKTTEIKPSGFSIVFENGSRVEMVPIDPAGEAGGNDTLIVYSELWGWKSQAHQKMWSEMTLSPNKFSTSQRWIDTYAGISGESPVLEALYETGVTEGRQLWDDWEVHANEPARMLSTWVTKHHLPWQTSEDGLAYYAEEAKTLTPGEYSRMHENAWGNSAQALVPPEWWDACSIHALGLAELPPLDKYKQVVVGIDAAVSNDCFGIVAVSRTGDKTIKRYSRQWTPPKGGKLIYSNPQDPSDVEYPEGVLRWLARTFNVIVFGYDPYQLHNLCTTLKLDGVGMFEEIKQGEPRLEADKQLFDVIRERRIVHDNDPDLTQHIKNANRKEDPESRQLRIVKRANHLKIDLAVGLSMATYMAYKYLPE